MRLLLFALLVLVAIYVYNTESTQTIPVYLERPLDIVTLRDKRDKYDSQLISFTIPKSWSQDANDPGIPCVYFASGTERGTRAILFSHSFEDNALSVYPKIAALARDTGCDIITYEYSGYGVNPLLSFDRTPKGLVATSRSVYEHVQSMGYEDISLVGEDVGCGINLQLALDLRGSAADDMFVMPKLCCLNPLNSYKNMARKILGSDEMVDERFDTVELCKMVAPNSVLVLLTPMQNNRVRQLLQVNAHQFTPNATVKYVESVRWHDIFPMMSKYLSHTEVSA